jgi:hypothetical protein
MKTPQDKPTTMYIGNVKKNDTIRTLPATLIGALATMDRADWVTFDFFPGYAFPIRPLKDWTNIVAKNREAITIEADHNTGKITIHDNDPVTPGTATFCGAPVNEKDLNTDDKDTPPFYTPVRQGHGNYCKPGYLLTIQTTEPEQEAEKTVSDPWIAKAASKDTFRPQMCRHYGNIATDGFRIHYDASLSGETTPFNWRVILDPCKAYTNLATVSNADLVRACKSVKRFAECITLTLNGSLQYSAQSDDAGTTAGEITRNYSHTDDDLTVKINAKYILDALSGMEDTVIISGRGSNYPVYITDGKREAVVMPVRM